MPIRNATSPREVVGETVAEGADARRGAGALHWGRAALTLGALGAVATLLSWKAIPCGFAALTHHPCPGCGSTRAVLALASGDLRGVLHYNPLGPAMALLVL